MTAAAANAASAHGSDIAAVLIAVLLLAGITVFFVRASRPRRVPRAAATPVRPRLSVPPYRDAYTPGRVQVIRDLRGAPADRVAIGYGLTLDAAARFRDLQVEAEEHGGTPRGQRAAAESGRLLSNPDNRRRWH